MKTPASLQKFKNLNYIYIGITVVTFLFLYLADSTTPFLLGTTIRLAITTGLLLALLQFRGKWLFLVYRINIFLLIISYVFTGRHEITDMFFWIRQDGITEHLFWILLFLVMGVLPVVIMIWIIKMTDGRQLKSYFKKQDFDDTQPETTPSLMKFNSESIEYLGLAPADLIMYLSIGAAIGGFFVDDAVGIIALYIIGVALGLYSIKIGSKPSGEFSSFVNFMKKYSYHVTLGIVVIIMVYRLFNFF